MKFLCLGLFLLQVFWMVRTDDPVESAPAIAAGGVSNDSIANNTTEDSLNGQFPDFSKLDFSQVGSPAGGDAGASEIGGVPQQHQQQQDTVPAVTPTRAPSTGSSSTFPPLVHQEGGNHTATAAPKGGEPAKPQEGGKDGKDASVTFYANFFLVAVSTGALHLFY